MTKTKVIPLVICMVIVFSVGFVAGRDVDKAGGISIDTDTRHPLPPSLFAIGNGEEEAKNEAKEVAFTFEKVECVSLECVYGSEGWSTAEVRLEATSIGEGEFVETTSGRLEAIEQYIFEQKCEKLGGLYSVVAYAKYQDEYKSGDHLCRIDGKKYKKEGIMLETI